MSNTRFSILQARAVRDTRISDSQFRTLAALGMYADQDGWCYPSLTTIGKDLGKSKQAVGRDTIALRKLGYLEVTSRFDKNGARRSSLYRLRFDLPRQHEVDAPSTSGVDAPSTSGVDVNDSINDPKNLIIKPALDLFVGYFGKFKSPKELDRWVILHEAAGRARAEELAVWASKKEIHLLNRPGLMDSLETAAKNWKEKANGKTAEPNIPKGAQAAMSWLAKKKAQEAAHG